MSKEVTYKDLVECQIKIKDEMKEDRHEFRSEVQNSIVPIHEDMHDLTNKLTELVKVTAENATNFKSMSKLFSNHMKQEDQDRGNLIKSLECLKNKNDEKLNESFFWKAEGIRTSIGVVLFGTVFALLGYLYLEGEKRDDQIIEVKGDTKEIIRILEEDFE